MAAEVAAAKASAAKINGQTIELSAKAQGDRLFGALHEAEIAAALGIDQKLIKTEPIKTVGEHKLIVHLAHGQVATITVTVVPAA